MFFRTPFQSKTFAYTAYVFLGLFLLVFAYNQVSAYPRSPIFVFDDAGSGICPAPLSGLVSHWAGEGNATDSYDGNDGVAGTGTGYIAGYVGQAFKMDGTGSGVSVPDAPNLSVQSAFTLEAWVKLDVVEPDYFLVSFHGLPDGERFAILTDDTDGSTFRFEIDCGNNCDRNQYSTTTTNTTDYFHVVGTYDGSNQVLYINGVAESSGSGVVAADDLPTIELGSNGFKGYLDSVSVYNRALTASEVLNQYNGGVSCANPPPPPPPPGPCENGIADGNETDVDCGGGTCPACQVGEDCAVDSDCSTNNCGGGVCSSACVPTAGQEAVEMTCDDFVDNDCDGLTDVSDNDCSVPEGGQISDIHSAPVAMISTSVPLPFASEVGSSASDIGNPQQIKFMTEAYDPDSGSVTVTLTVGDLSSVGSGSGTALICNDGELNGSETSVDCGGSSCNPCTNGSNCLVDSDCLSNSCVAGSCQAGSSCLDGDVNNSQSLTCQDQDLINDIVLGLEQGEAFVCADQNNDGQYNAVDVQSVANALSDAGVTCN